MLDAAGNVPAERTAFESKWNAAIRGGEVKRRMDALTRRQALPLKEKIELSQERIREWYEAWGGEVAVSFSGGKDSSVLLWLVRRLYPAVPAVFVHTGLEYPEVVRLVMATPNVSIIRPKMHFKAVIDSFGLPIVSKKVARGINVLRHPTVNNQNIHRLYDQGINRFGDPVNGFRVADRWRFLVDAPFEVSDRCCAVMKKEPIHRYERRTGRKQFVGMMADDSKQRQRTYLQHGCNAFDTKYPRSTPLGFWTGQDVLQCLRMHDIPFAPVYGDIVQDPAGRLATTGVSSTGCVFCAFGIHMEDPPNRFQRLKVTHPKMWRYCMKRIGLEDVFRYVREHCPDKSVRARFKTEPEALPEQMGLFN